MDARDPKKLQKVSELLGEAHRIMYAQLDFDFYGDDESRLLDMSKKFRGLAKKYTPRRYEIWEIDLETMRKTRVRGLAPLLKGDAKNYVRDNNAHLHVYNPKKVYRYEEVNE